MIKHVITISLLTLAYFSCHSQDNKLDISFKTLLKDLNAGFTMPPGFEETSVNKNLEVFYQYAIKDITSGFEVRYFLKPYDRILKDYNLKKFDPREHTYSLFLSAIANSSLESSSLPKIEILKQEDVQKDFNANWGATTAYKPNPSFGDKASFCAALAVKKDNIGELYIFWLFTDVKNQEPLMMKSFTSIKFH